MLGCIYCIVHNNLMSFLCRALRCRAILYLVTLSALCRTSSCHGDAIRIIFVVHLRLIAMECTCFGERERVGLPAKLMENFDLRTDVLRFRF